MQALALHRAVVPARARAVALTSSRVAAVRTLVRPNQPKSRRVLSVRATATEGDMGSKSSTAKAASGPCPFEDLPAKKTGATEEVTFQSLPGVKSTRVGYTGGERPDPTYSSVCKGDGHTEAIKIEYDPSILSYDKLLDVFFEEHMPVRKTKAQYKSAVWVHDQEQREKVAQKIQEVQGKLQREVVTDVEPVKEWYDAEEYHQNYIKKQTRRW